MEQGGDKQLRELKMIARELREIRTEINERPSFWKKIFESFSIGIIKGAGFFIGTTIIAGFAIYLIQSFVDWAVIQNLLSL